MPAVIFNGDAVKPLKDKLRFKSEASELHSGTFAGANNQASAVDVTGLDLANFRSAKILLSVYIDATTDLHESFTLDIIQVNGDFNIAQQSVGDDSGVEFSVDSSGQLQYTSSNVTGFSSSVFNYQVQVTA